LFNFVSQADDALKSLCIPNAMLGGSLVTMAWRVLRLWMEGSPPGMEGSCEYIE